MGFQKEKGIVRSLFNATENCNADTIEETIKNFVSNDFSFKGNQTDQDHIIPEFPFNTLLYN